MDGRPLVEMPARTIEWRPFEMQDVAEVFLYRFLSSFAADCLDGLLEATNREGGTSSIAHSPHFSHVRGLLGLISRCITAPGSLNLRQLDHLRRMLGGAYVQGMNVFRLPAASGANAAGGIPLMTPDEVLQAVQSAGAGFAGGLNRDTNRVLASVTLQKAEEDARLRYEGYPLAKLRFVEGDLSCYSVS